MTTKHSTPGTDAERIVPLSPDGTATPLYCVHASSGSAYSYLALARLLGADRPVYGIEAPGFEGDREPVASVPELAAEYAATLRQSHPDGAFHLLGWSLGGLIAFDMARRLTAAGAYAGKVIMVDTSAPCVAPPPPEREIVRRFLHDIAAALGPEPGTDLDGLLAGQPHAAAGTVFRAVERSGALPAELDAELLTERYAVFRAHVEAAFGYEVDEPYHGPVWHLVASDSPPQSRRWGEAATDLTEHVVPGGHHSVWHGDGLERLAGLTRAALAGTAGPHGPPVPGAGPRSP